MKALALMIITVASSVSTETSTPSPSPTHVRLVGGNGVSIGRVEVYYNNTWGTVCDDGWSLNDAAVVCRQLGFPGAISSSCCAVFGRGTGPIWLRYVQCTGSETSLSSCSHGGWGRQKCGHGEDAGVFCEQCTLECLNAGILDNETCTCDCTLTNYTGRACNDWERVSNTNATQCNMASGSAVIIAGSLAASFIVIIITFSLILGVVSLKYWRKKKNKDTVFMMKRNQPSRTVYNHTEVVIHPGETATLSDWEMTHSDLELQGDLGKGQFGDVKLAYLKTITCTRRVRNYMDRMIKLGNSMSTSNTVAVKYLKGTATCESKALFLDEIELMKKVSTTGNNHIVQLIGYILLEQPMAMVMEYVPFGDLHSNLIKWKEQTGELSMSSVQLNSDDTAGQNYLYSKETLKDQDIFSFAYQIVKGMKYLASMNVIHRDLACRNVLVGQNKTLKISDFGLSKEIDGVYASSSRTRLPVRWMAPEAITHRWFSEKSDIWSYGVCLWEICTLGEVPYGHLPNAEVARSIVKSILLERPPACNDKIHELMLRCWRKKASDRPTFTDIKTYLEGLIEKECGNMYIVLENDYGALVQSIEEESFGNPRSIQDCVQGENDDFTGEETPQDMESI